MKYQKPSRFVNKTFIHCSASDHAHHDDVSVMRRWHKKRGWSDVGYHFFIKKDGTIQKGRGLNRVPAAQRNRKRVPGHKGNPRTIAICLHGLKEELFTKEQFDSLRNLCQQINVAHKGAMTFHGHRELDWKECPVFDYKKVLKLDKKGKLGI